MNNARSRVISFCLLFMAAIAGARAQTTNPLPSFDFTNPADAQGWLPAHDISSLQTSLTGLVVSISGGGPYLFGPARDYPAGKLLRLHLRLKSEQGGTAQVFKR